MNNNHAKTNSSTPQPGYKQTKLGWIPEEWKVKKIGTLTSKVGSGSTPRGGESVYTDEGIPFIRSQNVNLDRLIMDDIRFIPLNVHEKMSSTKVFPNDVLLNITGASIGRSCVVPASFDEGNVNQHVCIIRPKDKLKSLFLQSYLSSYDGQKTILRSQVGGNREGLNHKNVRSILLPLPPLPEQKRIATILSTWDAAIRKLDQLIERKQSLKKGLMQQLLTGQRRFPEFIPPGGTRYQETKLGMVPEDWEVVRVGDVIKQIKRPLDWDDSQLYNLVSVGRRSAGVFFRESLYGYQIKTKNLQPIKEGDFLISKMQIVHGASALAKEEHEGMMVSSSYIILNAKDPLELDIEYFDLLSRQKWFYHLTYISSYGVHIEKMTFNFKDFLKKKIPVPPLEEQKKISSLFNSLEQEIASHQSKKEKLEEQKKGLMQQLLTGAVRVKL